ncbi:MAG TPA: hypothetical protein VIQ24_04715 [Pyrinomonadaceae bacterium]
MPTSRLGCFGMFSPPRTWASAPGASFAAQPAQLTISVRRMFGLPSLRLRPRLTVRPRAAKTGGARASSERHPPPQTPKSGHGEE